MWESSHIALYNSLSNISDSLLRGDILSLRQEVHTLNADLHLEIRSLHDRFSVLTAAVMEIKEMLAER